MTVRARLKRMEAQWVAGFASLLVSGLFAIGLGLALYLLLTVLAALFGWHENVVQFLLLLSSIIWLPLAIGLAAPQVAKLTRATESAEAGPLAPFV